MFRRRRSKDDEPVESSDELDDNEPEDDLDAEPDDRPAAGPWDESEVDRATLDGYRDFGGILLPGEAQFELLLDKATRQIELVTIFHGGSALQVQPFAAPRSAGIWDEVRRELAASVTAQGGIATEQDGTFGVELHARLPGRAPDGSPAVQLVRFVGVNGPRWFLRGIFTGDAYADPVAAEPIEAIFRSIVVVRGSGPMPPREPIPLRAPDDVVLPEDEPPAGPSLDPFERGPEITEVR